MKQAPQKEMRKSEASRNEARRSETSGSEASRNETSRNETSVFLNDEGKSLQTTVNGKKEEYGRTVRKALGAKDMTEIALSIGIIAVCSWISIPFAVPFTLQTFGVFAVLGTLGGRRGSLAVLGYLLLGAMGFPVFAGFGSGFSTLLGPTGGYIAGFLITALFMWLTETLFGKKRKVLFCSMLAGLLICYAVGTVWFLHVYTAKNGAMGIMAALSLCVFPFVIPDICKILLALMVSERLKRVL